MKTEVRAILIDPYTQKVFRITTGTDLADLYKAIGCQTVTRYPLGRHVDLWLDDEGLLIEEPTLFTLDGASQPFAGRGLILGNTSDGQTVACPDYVTLEAVRDMVAFPEPGSVEIPDPLIEFIPLDE